MEDTRYLRAWVLGGDARYPWAVEALRRSGLPVKTWGVPGLPDQGESLEAALRDGNLLLLPRQPFQGERLAIGPETVELGQLPSLLGKGTTVIAGAFPGDVEAWLQGQGIRCSSYQEVESYQMANAAVTAEGAIYLTLAQKRRTIAGSRCLVIGWGRIGRFLAVKLQALGAEVTVAARQEGQWAEIHSFGMQPEETGHYHFDLEEYDAVYNTVPALVMTERQGAGLPQDCLLMELASLPGGFAPELQGTRNIIMAQGLPAKVAPQTAGENLADGVWACLIGEGRNLE